MPTLSERDLRSVEKLFNAIQPILALSRERQPPQGSQILAPGAATRGDSSASTSILSPSAALQEGLSRYSAISPAGAAPSPGSTVDAASLERRLWTELGFAVWRVGSQKLHLMNFVAIDPVDTLAELACRLADYLKGVFKSETQRFPRLLAMAHLSSNHVLTLLQLFCARKTCVGMLNGEVEDGLQLHQNVCQYLTSQGHLQWMSQLYINFCDEAAERDAHMTCMPTVVVVALREVLECLRICAEQSKAAASAFLSAEPVAYVTYMFYGLKLRISRGALLRPHESDDPYWTSSPHGDAITATTATDEMARMATEVFRSVGIPIKHSSVGVSCSKYFGRLVRADLLRSMEAFQIPSAAGADPRERKSTAVLKEVKEMLHSMIPEASAMTHALTEAECAQLKALSAPLGGSSGALNRRGLSRAQLHQLIAFGRLNCYDEMTHHALDVMIEAVRTAHGYAHFAVHSTLSSCFELSVRGMQNLADEIHRQAGEGSKDDDSKAHLAASFVTPLLALYENVITIGHAFLALAETLKLGDEPGARLDSVGNSGIRHDRLEQSGNDVHSAVIGAGAAQKSPQDTAQAIERLQEEREQFMQRLISHEHTVQVRTVIYTVPNILRSDPMLFAIMEEMCRLGASPLPVDGADSSRVSALDAAGGSGRQGRYGGQFGMLAPPPLRQTTNESFARTDTTAFGHTSASGRSALTAGGRPLTNTSLAMGSFFFRPHHNAVNSPPPSSVTDPAFGAGGSGTRRQPPLPTRGARDASPSGTASAKDSAPSSPPKDTNFAKSFFKSFFGRRPAGPAADHAAAAHPAHLLENSSSNTDLQPPRPPLGGMGPSRPSLAEFDAFADDAAAAGRGGVDGRNSSFPAPVPQASWSDVPSYVTFVRGHVELFLSVLDDARLNVYVRIAAGFELSSITFTDTSSFDLYEGRIGVRAMLRLMTDALHSAHVDAQDNAGANGSPSRKGGHKLDGLGHGQREDARTTGGMGGAGTPSSEELLPAADVSPDMNTYDELTTSELVSLVTKVVHLLKKVYFTLGVAPLTSEAVLLTDLPLLFFAEPEVSTHTSDPTEATAESESLPTDGTAAQPATPKDTPSTIDIKTKRLLEAQCFDDVLLMWRHAVETADCDEDMDAASFKVLVDVFQRALRRGTLPRATPAAANKLVGTKGTGLNTGGADVGGGSALTVTDVRRPAGAGAGRPQPLTPLDNAPGGMVSFLNHSLHSNGEATLLHDNYAGSDPSAYLAGSPLAGGRAGDRRMLPVAAGESEADSVLRENRNAETLMDVFDTLVHRRPTVLSPAALQALFDLFSSHDAALTRTGRHCLIGTFDYGEMYKVYATMVRDQGDATMLVQLLGLMARNMQGEEMSEERLHERRVWLFKSHCIEELIQRLCRTLEAPHLAPLFVKLVPQTFRLLCAFEPSRETSPHLDDTRFLDTVSEAITNMEGTEYFLIVAQSVIDAATSAFDSVGTYLTAQTAALMTGPLHIMHGKWYAEKQTFLDLIPALATWALEHDFGLYQCLAEVVTGLLQCTSNVNSVRLVDFALSAGLPQWLPYLEMPPKSVSLLPFTGDPTYLQRFWTPVLANAPRRSDIRYAMTGGVRLSLGRWPERGFTILALFKVDALYSTIPLFEWQSNEMAEMAEKPVCVEVVGGDSLQLVQDGYRTTLNESHALQNFRAGRWLPVTLTLGVTNTLTAYIGGFKIGSATVQYFDPGTTATINVGFVNRTIPTSLFSISDIALWDTELSQGQVEAQLAYMCLTDSHPGAAKVPEFAIPYTLGRRDATPPVDECIAQFVPHEHNDGLLRNLLNTEDRYPLLAKIIGRNAVTPQYWVNYYQLFISRSGAHHLLDWLRRATSSEEAVSTVQLLMEATRRTNSAEMERPFLYLRLAHGLKQVAPLITTELWDAVLYGATSHVIINDEEHRIAINRYIFEFVLANMELHNGVDDDVTLYVLERLEKMFNPSTCRYAKHNAQFICPVRFVDRLLNSLVFVADNTSIAVRAATIACARQVVVACDMEESLVHCLTSLVALLTPSAVSVASRFTPSLEVAVPVVRHVRTRLSVLVAQNLTTLILRNLVECASTYTTFMTAFCRVVDLSWYALCVSRFADPVAVVYATRLFFEAAQRSPALLEDAMQHQASIVEALRPHAIHDDLTLFLLSLTIGCSRNVDLLAQNHSLLQQLDGVLNSCTPEPNPVVAPIFVKIFVYHLGAVVRTPHALPFPINTVHQRHRYNGYRVRKYFRLAFVCCRLMLLIQLKRYRTTLRLDLRRLREQAAGASGTVGTPLDASWRLSSDVVPLGGGGVMAAESDAVTPSRSPTMTGHSSPHHSQNPSFTLSFAGGPSTFYTPRLPSAVAGGGQAGGMDGKRLGGAVAAGGGGGGLRSPSPVLVPSATPGRAPNASFASEGLGSFASPLSTRPRVHSQKWRRAFAVLRVCILLWIPLQCRRHRWVFLRKQAVKPEQLLQRRHPGTLFALRALKRYSAQPSLFYVLVSSPLETSALSSLLPYISKEHLAERTQAWTEYLHKLGPSLLSQASSLQRASSSAIIPSGATKLIAESEAHSNASDDSIATSPTSVTTQGRASAFVVPGHLPGVEHVVSASAVSERDVASPMAGSTKNNSSAALSESTAEAHAAGRPPPPPLPQDDARRDAAVADTPEGPLSPRVVAPLSFADSFADLPPTVETTAIPGRRRQQAPLLSIQVPPSAPLAATTPTEEGGEDTERASGQAATTAETRRCRQGARAGPQSSSHSASSRSDSGHSQGTRSRSSSSSNSDSSSSSSGSSRSSSLGATQRDTTAADPPQPVDPPADATTGLTLAPSMLITERSLLAMADGGSTHDADQGATTPDSERAHVDDSMEKAMGLPSTHVDSADAVERAVASLGEGVRQETVSVLSALIRSSLNVLPAQRWIGGPSYGSCGGLLFQLMFISSAATSSEDLSATLVRFFLVEVTTCVHEQQITMDTSAVHVGSPLIPSLSNSLVFDSARNSLSLRGVAAERVDSSPPGSVANNSSFQSAHVLHHAGSTGSNLDPMSPMRAPGMGAAAGAHNTSSSSSNVDVLLFNVSHFTELVVDMLSINVLELMTARDYLHSLLVLCLTWPSRFVDQLSSQVMRACVSVLNRPSQNDVPVEMIRTIYDLTKIVLRPHWHMKGMIECLLRVLYRVYTAFPPVYMTEEDAQLRKDYVVLIFRHIVKTYAGSKELHKALSVRTLTQRFSLYDAFKSTLLKDTDVEACAAFHAYAESHASTLETLMSGRPRQKADAAFRTAIKIRTEYIKRLKSFNQHYVSEVEMRPGWRPEELVERYMSHCTSYAASVPRLLDQQLVLLPIDNCALPDMLNTARFTTYHYMDMARNFATVPRPRQDKVPPIAPRRRQRLAGGHLEEDARTAARSAARRADPDGRNDGGDDEVEEEEEEELVDVDGARANAPRTRAPPLDEDLDLRQAAVCEEQVNHMAALVPAFAVRSRPFLTNGERPSFIGENIVVTPSAINLLWYLIEPDEVLRFMSNGFRINGLHATPCLILLTNRSLKVISFSRVTEAGDIILCQKDADATGGDDDETKSTASGSVPGDGAESGKGTGGGSKRKAGFNIMSVTKQLQRLLSDGKSAEMKERIARDGTRVAQAVRQSTSKAYSQLYWSYATSNMRQVRCLRYMHLNTAVLINMYHDDGVFLSVVDSKQSMNPSVREEFLVVLRDVVKMHRCEFIDSSQRATDMRSMLIRWAAGSVSNYEYLSFLNRTAGRTVKDFNQYPVFPWVLADYGSDTLDLENAATFRDFRYPMGAQLAERREMVSELYANTSEVLDPETGRSYPFHHGTHYSTSGGVLYFLLRAEPFATFARDFQGGNFDVATRLFDSVAASFRSCELGPADCKELLPEFYHNSRFLLNADHLDFGSKSDGEKVDDVHLPPWAKGSVQVFTAVMRYALESDHALHNVHHWIDLVFGVRRRGPLAVERLNTFQRMTYGEEVVVALQQAQTPHDCDVIIAEVDNFGQTPLQLFQERHPSHIELEPVKKPSGKDGGSAGAASFNGTASMASTGGASSASFALGEFKPGTLLKTAHTAYGSSSDARTGSRTAGLASGNTYTNAFQKEMPKVMLMLVQALANPITHFTLSEPSPALFQPPPPALVERFRVKPAVTAFDRVGASQKIACSYPHMVAVEGENYFICWHEREGRLLRFLNSDGHFLSVLPFRSPDDRTVRVTTVVVSPRESFVGIGTGSGAIYCFYPTLREGTVAQTSSLCFHRHPVRGMAVDAVSGRALSYTTSALDYPVVWRVQRCHSAWMHTLDLAKLLPVHESRTETDHDRTVVSAFIDPASLMSVLATPRYLLLFDINGDPFAGGKLPGLVVRRRAASVGLEEAETEAEANASNAVAVNDPIMLEDEDGSLGIAVSPVASSAPRAALKPTLPPEPDMTCITAYQCTEWASGMQLFISGHIDGSIGLWRSTRLPPDTVQPGKIAVVEFHQMVIRGDGSVGAVTALWQDRPDVPHFFVGYADGSVKVFSFEEPSAKEENTKSK